MPVLINRETGLAEDLAQGNPQNTHDIPLNDPAGNPVSVPLEKAQGLLSHGYTQPSTDQLKNLLSYAKFSSTGEQVKSFLHGAGKAATFGLSTALEDPESARNREAVNPGLVAGGEALGLGASMLIGSGEAALLGKAGTVAAKAVGLGAAESVAGRIAASAIRSATETALYSAGNEVSKLISRDPEQSVQTALTHVGLAGAIGGLGGGLVGAVSPTWDAIEGSKMGEFLSDFKDRVGSRLSGKPAETVLTPGAIKNFPAKEGVPLFTEKVSAGTKWADWSVDKAMGQGVSAGMGAWAAKMVGVPKSVGALIGIPVLGPMFDSVVPHLVKPILEGAVNSVAFKNAVEFGVRVAKGESLVNKVVQSVFTTGASDLGERLTPTPKQKEMIEDAVKQAQLDPTFLMNMSQSLGHYLPDHAMSAGATVANAIQFLNAQRPNTTPVNPLDSEKRLSASEKYKFDRSLTLAQQPLMAMEHIKKGTIVPEDVHLVKSVYPGLYNNLVAKLTDSLITAKTKGEIIPYHIRQGLSLFLGRPLDSTLTPQAIAMNQAKPAQPGPDQGGVKKGTKPLSKLPGLYAANSMEDAGKA